MHGIADGTEPDTEHIIENEDEEMSPIEMSPIEREVRALRALASMPMPFLNALDLAPVSGVAARTMQTR